MTFQWRYSVLTAVSLEQQATEDRDSLDHQLRTARAFGDRMGGTFVREYRAEGFSRSGWFEFSDVRAASKEFDELAHDARAHKFDVILMESFDRLGDLGVMWYNYLASLGPPYIQLRSVQQPLMIEEPSLYHPRREETTINAIADALKINKYRTDKVYRAFQIGNTRRAKEGKYSVRVPLGYRKVDKETVVIDERVAPLLVDIAQWFLDGTSLAEICRKAEATGIKPGWNFRRVKYVLFNPFNTGMTFYGRTQDPNTQLYKGRHEPLWDWDTHLRILDEYERRKRVSPVSRRDYNFTGLIQCSQCDKHLYIAYKRTVDGKPANYKLWRCPNKHVAIPAKKANQMVADELRRLHADLERHPVQKQTVKDFTKRELARIDTELKRLDDAYFQEHPAFSAAEYSERKRKLEADREQKQDEQRTKAEAERRGADHERAYLHLRDMLPRIDIWLQHDDPRMVKYWLSMVVTMTAYPDKTIKVDFIAQ